jgi:hypothetical protein
MTAPHEHGVREIPTFSECVLGYRAWEIDDRDRLWPLSDHRRPWAPGINTARCNCRDPNALSFEWNWSDGRRVLEPAPQHAPPVEDCVCGLYAWRRPSRPWALDRRFASGRFVCGAVAAWGQVQVHHDGVRAQYACVTVLAFPRDTDAEAMRILERVATEYRVELVPLCELEAAASHYASPLPDSIYPDPPATVSDSPAERSRPRLAPRPRTPPFEIGVRDRIGLLLLCVCAVPLTIGAALTRGGHSTVVLGWILSAVGAAGFGLVVHHFWPTSSDRRRQKRSESSRPSMTESEFQAIADSHEPRAR